MPTSVIALEVYSGYPVGPFGPWNGQYQWCWKWGGGIS